MYTAPRGTIDILPEDQPYWHLLRAEIMRVAEQFGYQRIDVPCFEETALYVRGVGQGTDIVDKEMYSFEDKGGRDITLRPEFTAGIVRAYIEHGMRTLPQPVKLYTMGPIFRYERVQAGRYRQHTQFDIECIGEQDPAVDLEVMSVAWQLYANLGFKGLAFQLNSTGCPRCRPGYIEVLVAYYQDHWARFARTASVGWSATPCACSTARTRVASRSSHRRPTLKSISARSAPTHFATLRGYLDALGRPYTVNHRLVRGLDYYTKTVFEVWAQGIGAQNAVCGGGRYDGLAEELGGPPTPGIGFGSGMERLVLAMKEQGLVAPPAPAPQVVLVYLGDPAKSAAIKLLQDLISLGVRAQIGFGDRSMRSQMRGANRLGARYALIVGEQELQEGVAVLNDLSGEQPERRLPLGQAAVLANEVLANEKLG